MFGAILKNMEKRWIFKSFSHARLRGSSSSSVELSPRPFVSCWVFLFGFLLSSHSSEMESHRTQGFISSASTCVSLTCKFLSVHYLCHVPRFSQRSTQIVTDRIGVSFEHMTIPTMKFGWMERKNGGAVSPFFSIKIWKSIEEMKRWIDFYPPTRLLKYNSRPVIGGKKFPESTI